MKLAVYVTADGDGAFLQNNISMAEHLQKAQPYMVYSPLAEHLTRLVALREPTQVPSQPRAQSCIRDYIPCEVSTYPITQSLNIIFRQLLAIHQALYPSIKCRYRRWLCCWRESMGLWQLAYVHIHLRIHPSFVLRRSMIRWVTGRVSRKSVG